MSVVLLLSAVLLGAPEFAPGAVAPAAAALECPTPFTTRECHLWSLVQRYRALARARTEERDVERAASADLRLDLTGAEGRERALAARIDALDAARADEAIRRSGFRAGEVLGVGLVLSGVAAAVTGWLACGDGRLVCRYGAGGAGVGLAGAGIGAILAL